MNCLYNLDNVYAFNKNTVAFIEREDEINESSSWILHLFILL